MGNLLKSKNKYKWLTQKSSSISPLVDKTPVELLLNSSPINAQRPLRTSELSALEKKVSVNQESHFITRDPHSIESSLNSWPKVEISPPETELEENLSTE